MVHLPALTPIAASQGFSEAASWTFTSFDCWAGLDVTEYHLRGPGTCGAGQYVFQTLVSATEDQQIVLDAVRASYYGLVAPYINCVLTLAEEDSDEDLYRLSVGYLANIVEYQTPIKLSKGKSLIVWRIVGPVRPVHGVNLNISYRIFAA